MDSIPRARYATRVKRPLLALVPLLAALGCPKSGPDKAPASAPAAEPTPAAVSAPPPEAPPKVAAGGPCAATQVCAEGLVCTTEAGACDKPPGCGPDDICPQVCYGVCEAPPAAAAPGCKTDADCRTFSNYCGGCGCDALAASAPDPKCAERPVNCVMNPCQDKVARCLEGACVLRDAPPAP